VTVLTIQIVVHYALSFKDENRKYPLWITKLQIPLQEKQFYLSPHKSNLSEKCILYGPYLTI
jgi:hypothetical protein